ncbi:hypothetical protein M409DRAFT_17460 [Zasmidium cellare ATCC 36951]|uniref:Uncharacterized protein n=1 Tax=Zasmidium cellare ATCC 36951 TaxID=1080233 RepID=A0A6A6D213_ZASCE|nr:uncharacterized protein M409DRAFT_17460 [Zasmidium cellare ATCC 36951]KAF2172222.1 hypothetical protein M409DRAFT_17460 [Zasmidium cellare ATCC 36951]
MASHVARLSVRPDDQFSTEVKSRDFADTNGVAAAAMPASSSTWIPQQLRFPAAVLMTFSLSSLLLTLSSPVTGPELAAVSRDLTTAWHITAMVIWKVAELWIAWYACYDYLDLAYLTLLNNVPHYFLLNTFYGIDLFTAILPLAIDIITITLPFAVFRRLNSGHADPESKTVNQQVVQDKSIQTLVTVFGSAVYTIVVFACFKSWIPTYMVTHFGGLRSLTKAHDANVVLFLTLFLPLGFAASQFIFVPAIASAVNPGLTDPNIVPEKVPFNPQTATLGQTLAYNLGFSEAGFTPRAEIVAKRTLILSACSFTNSFVRAYFVIEGTEVFGALGWASVWALAAGITGVGFAWIGDE